MLASFGCSFTYGEELENPKTQAYPFLLSKMLNEDVQNYGLCGAGNSYIKRTTVQKILHHKPKYAIIQWSEVSRLELYASMPVTAQDRYNNYTGLLQTNIRWTGKGVKFVDEYYKNWYNEEHSFSDWIASVLCLQDFLKNHNINYVMFNAFGNQQLIKKYTIPEYKYIDTDRFLGWPDEGFVEWVYGTERKPQGHPNEEAHQIIAEKLYEYFKR